MLTARPMVIFLLGAVSSIVAQERAAGAVSPHRRLLSRQQLRHMAASSATVTRRPLRSRVGVDAYRRFHANDSLVGRSVPCTSDEKTCFQYNMLFDSKLDKCQRMAPGINTGCALAPDRQAFENGSGRIIGICRTYHDPCPGFRLAYDGRCYPKEMVRDVICGCKGEPTRHLLGGVECRCTPGTPIPVNQPLRKRHCRIPDLRFPDFERKAFLRYPHVDRINYTMTCTDEQSKCFSQHKVWLRGVDGCFRLLGRGPCPQDHVLVLDRKEAVRGRAVTRCSHLRGGCPPGQHRMVFDGRCHSDRFLKIAAPGYVFHNIFGDNVIIPNGMMLTYEPTSRRRNICDTMSGMVGSPSPAVEYSKPPCGVNNKALCSLYQVESEPPIPD